MKRMISLLLALVMVFALTACGAKEEAPAADAVSFKVVVTDLDGKETTFEYSSNAASVGEALVEEGLIEGHETEYGLYIDTVNGITADWDADQTYWAFYINGEYATTGIDGTEIVADTTYSLTLTKG
jgi:ABC-type Fe3+-hydroxamate transport system substrate-binding protein